MKIVIWGRSGNDTTNDHRDKIIRLGMPLVLLEGDEKNSQLLADSQLIINHDGGFQKPTSAWQINTGGGGMPDEPPIEISTCGKIHWNTFIENLEKFFNHIKGKSEIAKEDIEVLYSIDPKIEKLLEPFATYHPLDTMTTELKRHKTELLSYIEDKLSKLS